MSLLELCQWIEETEVGTGIRQSLYVFPIIESAHVLGLALSVGLILWFDLRTMGLIMRKQPVSTIYKGIWPWMSIGFFIMFISGILLFWAHAATAYTNFYFRIKFAAMALAGANAMYFHFGTRRGIAQWDKAPLPPMPVRMAGFLSLLLWTVVIAAGRLMAYTFF